jgi:hypothetical protein
MWNLKIIQMNLCIKQKQTQRHRRQTYSYSNGRGKRGGINQDYGIKRYNKIDKQRDIQGIILIIL